MMPMITINEYFGAKLLHLEATPEMQENAAELLARVNTLLDEAVHVGAFALLVDPDTGTPISGAKGGSGDGGFRLSTSTTGGPKSAHRKARGIDIYDPRNQIDAWLTDAKLEEHGLFREHPSATPGWCHLQDIPPASGNRTFYP